MPPGSVAGLTVNSTVDGWSGGPFPNKKPTHEPELPSSLEEHSNFPPKNGLAVRS